MKKIFALAIAFVSMVAAMTSCQQDDNTDFIQQSAPQKEVYNEPISSKFDGNIYFAATADQLQYCNNNYKVTIGEETKQISISDMTVVDKLPASVNCVIKTSKSMPTFYVYHIPADTKGNLKVYAAITVKEGVELPETMDISASAAINGHGSIGVQYGLMKDKVDSYITRRSAAAILNQDLK